MVNINTLPSEKNRVKLDLWRNLVTTSDINVVVETNKDQRYLQSQDKTENLIKGWWQRSSARDEFLIEERNKNNTDTRQQGGVSMIKTNSLLDHICQSGGDERNLGRWRWITLRGKQGRKTTIIGTYRTENGWVTSNNQLAAIRNTEDGAKNLLEPTELWFSDLKELIQEKQDNGHSIILCGDFNDDMTDDNARVTKFAKKLNMREVILGRHGKQNAPHTYDYGSKPIDGIFVSDEIDIEQGGYIDALECPGDHCALWVDIRKSALIGEEQDFSRKKQSFRKVTSKIPSVKKNFQKLMEEQMKEHGMRAKVEKLYDQCIDEVNKNNCISKSSEREMDILFDRLTRAKNYAEKRCRKLRAGRVPYSKTVHEARGKCIVLKMVQKRWILRGKRQCPKTRDLKRAMKKYRYRGRYQFDSKQEIEDELKKAVQAYNKLRPKASEQRETFLGNLATEMEEEDGIDAKSHFKTLQHREDTRAKFQRIKRAEKKIRGGGVSVVEKIVNGVREKIRTKDGIVQEIIRANTEKVLQANNTPLREEPLRTLLGEQGDFQKWEDILKGLVQLPIEGIEEGTRLWYEFITSPTNTSFDIQWTAKEYFDGWKKMKEETVSIPGWHFSHLKSIDPFSDTGEVVSKLALLPLKTGYVPQEWRYGIDSMIPKKLSDLRPEKLRLVLLMDCRFNHNNKLIGKKMMEYGEKNNLIAKEQYGSRKRKSAIQHALNKRLVLDTIRHKKAPAVYCANDAKSCYDRIIFMVAYLTMRRMNIPEQAAKCAITGLIEMKHHIRTVFGDSEEYYGGEKWKNTEIPHGNGQGNGNGPALWAAISSPLLFILRAQGYGVKFLSPIGNEEIVMAAFGFVDDMDYVQTAGENDDMEDTLIKAQKGMDLWESLLRTSGGAIETSLTKTDWVKIDFKWKNGTWKYAPKNEEEKIRVRNFTGDTVDVIQLSVEESRETLGVMQTPSGSETAQVEKLTSKIDKWADNVMTSGLRADDAREAIRSTIGKTIDYPLPATAMNQKECYEVTKRIRKCGLPKSGIVRNAASQLVFGSEALGGFGFMDIYTKQLMAHIQMLLDHGHESTETGQLLRCLAEGVLLESGLLGNLFEIKPSECTWIEHNWIVNTLAMMEDTQIRIMNDIKQLKQWKTNDTSIMKAIYDTKLYSKKEMKDINTMRMHLQVTMLSDLTTADGKKFTSMALDCSRDYSSSSEEYNWPRIPGMPKRIKNLWKKALIKTFTDTNENIKQEFISVVWNEEAIKHQKWWFSDQEDRIYQRDHNDIKIWSIALGQRNSRRKKYQRTGNIDVMPEDLTPVSIAYRSNMQKITVTGISNVVQSEESQEEHTGFEWNKKGWPVRRVYIPEDDGAQFCQEIRNNRGKIVCDGSYKKGRSTSAFRSIGPSIIRGTNVVPGRNEDQSSYRGELGGMLGAIICSNELMRHNNITDGSITLGCDNEGAIKAIDMTKEYNSQWNSYDILFQIRKELKRSPVKWTFKHVKGHQDEHQHEDQLDEWALANISADKMAKREMKKYLEEGCPYIKPLKIDGDMWQLKIGEDTVVKNIMSEVLKHKWDMPLKQYWAAKMGAQDINMIDWDIFTRTNKMVTRSKRQWRSKHVAGIGPTANKLFQRKHRESAICPRCSFEENNKHVHLCKTPETDQIFENAVEGLEGYLEGECSLNLAKAIILLIRSARTRMEPNWNEIEDQDVIEIMQEQWQFNYTAIMWGIWIPQWKSIQDKFLKGTRKSSALWFARVSNEIWKITEDLWKHRNHCEHEDMNSRVNIERISKIDGKIEDIYSRLPSRLRLLPMADRKFFRKDSEWIKRRRLKEKEKWCKQAEKIIVAYEKIEIDSGEARLLRRYFLDNG